MSGTAPLLAALALLSPLAAVAAAPPKMQAIVQTAGTDVAGLKLQTVDTPAPAAGQVRIRVVAAAVNPVDWKRQAAAGPGGAAIPGFDVAGTIESLGPGAQGFRVGDAVFARVSGAYAEYVVAPAADVVRKPQRLSFEQAAGIPVAGVAGLRAVEAAKVQAGQRVAIIGAAGGAGSTAVEVAKARGARVIAIGHSSQQSFLKSLGADEFVAYDKDPVAQRVKDVDAVLNMVEGQATPGLKYVKHGGALASIAGAADAAGCTAAQVSCVQIGPGYRGGNVTQVDELRELAKLADEGKYTVRVTKTFPLAEVAAAQKLGKDGQTMGKIVLKVQNP